MQRFLTAVVALACLRPAAAGDRRPVTIDDLMRMRAISDVRISPDGSQVAYVVSEASFERNAYDPNPSSSPRRAESRCG